MTDNIQAAIDAGRGLATAGALDPDETPLLGVVLPAGYEHQVVDLRHLAELPDRKRGVVRFDTHASLTAYVNRHIEGGTVVYANPRTRAFTAVINANESDTPDWGDHRAVLTLLHTPAWQAWTARDGQLSSQVAFAEHIEANELDIVDPPAAVMLELAETFQANTKVTFKSAHHLDSGQRELRYEEDVQAAAGRAGAITIPKLFQLGIAPFEGVDPYRLIARLRYRIGNGNLQIGYQLVRPDDVLRAAFDDIEKHVAEGITADVPIYRGAGD